MRLFIQIKNGAPFEHPILEENLREAFPDVDLNNLPTNFALFNRVPIPEVTVYEKYLGVTYEFVNNFVTDIHHVQAMTQEEILEKQNAVKTVWAKEGYLSWVFDEAACSFKPPIDCPEDGNLYYWDEPTLKWVNYNLAVARV